MHERTGDEALLAVARHLAEGAAEAILAVQRAGFRVEGKRDRTIVTAADHLAEALIVEGLRAAFPGLPVVAEEEHARGLAAAPPASGTFWLVDPLDGTEAFARGLPDYAVHIGLVRDGAPALGVVALPATREVFWGGGGLGACKQDAGGTRAILVRARGPAPVVMVSGRHAADPCLADWLHVRQPLRLQRAGSSVKVLRVAEGQADLYPRFHPSMEWDTAAPQAVLEGAGGRLDLWDGSPLRYGKPGWINPGFLVQGGAGA